MRCFQSAPLLLMFCVATSPMTVWGDSKTEAASRMLQAEELGQSVYRSARESGVNELILQVSRLQKYFTEGAGRDTDIFALTKRAYRR